MIVKSISWGKCTKFATLSWNQIKQACVYSYPGNVTLSSTLTSQKEEGGDFYEDKVIFDIIFCGYCGGNATAFTHSGPLKSTK